MTAPEGEVCDDGEGADTDADGLCCGGDCLCHDAGSLAGWMLQRRRGRGVAGGNQGQIRPPSHEVQIQTVCTVTKIWSTYID